MRLFTGISLPDCYQQSLAEIKEKWNPLFMSKLNWTKPGNWHLTLKFLGEVDEDILPEIKAYVQNINFKEFRLKGAKAGFFGSKGQYRVMWLGLEKDVQPLINLAGNIDRDLNSLGFEREKRLFKGHLTLARVKKFFKDDPWCNFSQSVNQIEWPEFRVEQIMLWQSILTQKGPRYEIVANSH